MGNPVNFYAGGGGVGSSIDTVLFLPLDTNYTDLTGRHTFVSAGTTTISGESITGTGSLSILPTQGTSGQYDGSILSRNTPHANWTDFSLGTADFVIDTVVRIVSLPSWGNASLDVMAHGTKYGAFFNSGTWYIYLFSNGFNPNWSFRFGYQLSTTGAELAFPTTSANSFSPLVAGESYLVDGFEVEFDGWYRLTAIRSGTNLNLHISGGGFFNSIATYSIGTINLVSGSEKELGIGGEKLLGSYADNWNGYIDYVLINRNVNILPTSKPINFYESGGGVGSSTDTVLFLPLETDYTDLTGRHSFVTVGTVTISGQSITGVGSLLFAPTYSTADGYDFSALASTTSLNASDFSLGTADFVIDCVVRIVSLPTQGNASLNLIGHGTKYGGAFPSPGSWYIYLFSDFFNPNWSFRFGYAPASGSQFEKVFPTGGSGTFTPHIAGYDLGGGILFDGWYRLTAIRVGTALNLHLSGAEFNNDIASYSIGTLDLSSGGNKVFTLGGDYVPSSGLYVDSWNGYIDYVLINKNVNVLPTSKPINFYSKT